MAQVVLSRPLIALVGLIVLALVGVDPPARGASWELVPIDASRFLRPPASDESSVRFERFVANACRYAMTTWYEDLRGYDLANDPYLRPPGSRNVHVRPLGAFAETCAIALATGIVDSSPGAPPPELVRERTIRLLTAVARSNRANGGNWGGSEAVPHGTDSTNLAAPVLLAAWLLWPDLTVEERTFVVNMARYEAETLMETPVRYYRDRRGRVFSKGNSGAEELVWNATFLSLVANMFPGHPSRQAWEQRIVRSTVAAWARPSDVTSAARYNGRSVADWVDGSNLNEDGTLTNGDIDVHPFYMTAVAGSVFQLAPFALAGREGPASVRFNVDVVYRALTEEEFRVEDGFAPPGGTIYVPGTADIYYPSGTNKQANAYIAFAAVDSAAGLLGADTGVEPRADVWERLHAERAVALQARSGDGRSNLTAAEGGKREEFWLAYWGARGYLMKWLGRQVGFELHDRPMIRETKGRRLRNDRPTDGPGPDR